MDCERFEAALMDELYGELDELTSAAMKRHAASCAKCGPLLAGLAATRRLVAVPVVQPPLDLEERILSAARDAQKVVPFRASRLSRVVSLAGSWAMRPQTAMAAVFLVMIGTSVLLISGKASRAPASASVVVTEQGNPAAGPATMASAAASAAPEGYGAPVALDRQPSSPPGAPLARADLPRDEAARIAPRAAATAGPAKDDDELAQNAPASPPPPPAAAAPLAGAAGAGWGAGGTSSLAGDVGGAGLADKKSVSPLLAAIQTYQAGRYDEAARAFGALAPSDPAAELWAARATRESKGCRAALARFDRAAGRGAGTATAWDALLEGGLCYRSLGDYGNARTRLSALLSVDSHKDRARAELDRINQMQSAQGSGGSAGAAKAAPAPAAPPPSRPSASAVDLSGY